MKVISHPFIRLCPPSILHTSSTSLFCLALTFPPSVHLSSCLPLDFPVPSSFFLANIFTSCFLSFSSCPPLILICPRRALCWLLVAPFSSHHLCSLDLLLCLIISSLPLLSQAYRSFHIYLLSFFLSSFPSNSTQILLTINLIHFSIYSYTLAFCSYNVDVQKTADYGHVSVKIESEQQHLCTY